MSVRTVVKSNEGSSSSARRHTTCTTVCEASVLNNVVQLPPELVHTHQASPLPPSLSPQALQRPRQDPLQGKLQHLQHRYLKMATVEHHYGRSYRRLGRTAT